MTRHPSWLQGCAAVVLREWRSTAATALGWCVLAAFAALAGTVFAVAVWQSGAPATLRGTFIAMGWAVLAMAPALTMRSVAEERRHGTWASLLAAPAGGGAAVVGKFVAAVGVLAVAVLVPTLAQLGALEMFARPDYGEAATAVLGLVLAGAAYAASGLLMSALVGNQVGAYLLTLFLWIIWVVLAKSVPAVLPARWAYVAFGLDPLRRLDDFLLGLLDTSNVVFWACVAGWFVFATVLACRRPVLPARLAGRWRTAAALAAAAALCVGVCGMAGTPRAAVTVDMTKTRAYTLALGTLDLLGQLDGSWTVAVVQGAAGADPAVVRQMDEVLAGFERAGAGHVKALRVDPATAEDAARYEEVLEAVQARDAAALAKHNEALARGLAAFNRLVQLASAQQVELARVISTLPADSQDRAELDSLRGAFAQLTAQKGAFDRSIAELRTATDARPFADPARAAAAVAANLRHWSEQLGGAARALAVRARSGGGGGAGGAAGAGGALGEWLRAAVPQFEQTALDLASAQDALDRLPRLYGAEVGAALAAGDAIIVVGPPGVAVVPAWQMVAAGGRSGPGGGPGGGGRGVVFDRRFRGEQVIGAAMRSLRAGELPVVVFVHSGATGALRPTPEHADFAAAADALRAARFEVREWIPGEGPEPTAAKGRPLVWVVVPPMDRDGVADSPRERALLGAAQRLVARGDPVLLSIGPSLLPLLGQADPWAALLKPRGVTAETGRAVLEVVPLGPNRAQTVAEQLVRDMTTQHPVGAAVDGQLVRLDRVVPLVPAGDARAVVLAAVEPAPERWIETDWRRDQLQRLEAPADKVFAEPVPAVVAVEGAQQRGRAVLVGSPSWLYSTVADAADPLGGGRVALRYPGNRELLVNAAAWLAGRDDLVASTGTGREVGRLPRLSRGQRVGMALVQAAGVPCALAVLGAVVVLRRRSRT